MRKKKKKKLKNLNPAFQVLKNWKKKASQELRKILNIVRQNQLKDQTP